VAAPTESTARTGLLYGLAAYTLWGIVPLYFKSVGPIPPIELLAHRIVYSTVFLIGVLALLGRLKVLVTCLKHWHSLRLLLLSTIFIASNWYVFIYSVLSGQIMQGSLGYFILPLVNVAIGTVFFRERMRLTQWIALAFAMAGVLTLTLWDGRFPWIALTLAFSFSLYGVLRKQAAVDATVGLTVETLLLTPVSLIYLAICAMENRLVFGSAGRRLDVLVILSGLVTSIPLICFAQAVQRLQIVTIGFLQYISPSLAFLIAVLWYDESFPRSYQIGYGLIWGGLAVFVADALMQLNKPKRVARKEAEVLPLD